MFTNNTPKQSDQDLHLSAIITEILHGEKNLFEWQILQETVHDDDLAFYIPFSII